MKTNKNRSFIEKYVFLNSGYRWRFKNQWLGRTQATEICTWYQLTCKVVVPLTADFLSVENGVSKPRSLVCKNCWC